MINDETLKNIENLHRLKTDGVITQEEFDKAKSDLLNGPVQRASRNPMPVAATTNREPGALPAQDDHFGWMILPLKRYFDFAGRSTRKEFWMFLLLTNLISGGLAIIALADTSPLGYTGSVGSLMFGLIGLLILGAIIPMIAAQVRRFHDQDMSGWFALLNLIPYLGLPATMVLMMIEGTRGENRFGPDPLGRSAG